jgi:hypothetical protein
MAMEQLIYSSTFLGPESGFQSILECSRHNNQAAGLTGMLLYANCRILQVLEGERAAVERVFTAILKDPRHNDISVISRDEIQQRSFRQWSMGFKSLREIDLGRWPEYGTLFGFTPTELSLRSKPGSALQALLAFSK